VSKVDQRKKEKAAAQAKLEERKRVTLKVLADCSETGDKKLAELAGKGIVPSCGPGCSHCCRLEVPISRAEGEVVVEWLHANRTPEQLEAIRDKLRAWIHWYRVDYPKLIASGLTRVEIFAKHAPLCSMIENDSCSVYPVRPILCRNHHVSSPVAECDPATTTREPEPIFAVPLAARAHVMELQNLVSRQGGDYFATVHLIGEWFAHLLEVEREPWQLHPKIDLGR
jgi:Fe-S-cluster containining protein